MTCPFTDYLDFIILRMVVIALTILFGLVLWRLQNFLAAPLALHRLRTLVRAARCKNDEPVTVENFCCDVLGINQKREGHSARMIALRAEIARQMGDGTGSG